MKSILFAHFQVAWRYCLRSRTLNGVVLLGIGVMLIAALMASFSLRQPLVMALDIGFSGVRVLGAFLAIFWIQDMFFKDIERRLVMSTFAYPIPKASYVIGRFCGVVGILLLSVAIWSVGLYVLGSLADWGYQGSSRPIFDAAYPVVMLALVLDLTVIAGFSLLVVSAAETAFVPLFCGLGFSIAARGVGSVIGYLELSLDADDVLKTQLLPWLHGLRWLLPDLGSLDLRAAMLYGDPLDFTNLAKIVLACFGYLILMLLVTIINYERREFS